MEKDPEFEGVLKLFESNNLDFTGQVKLKSRFSIWKDETNFTAAQVKDIEGDYKFNSLGEQKKVSLIVWNTQLAQELQEKDIVQFGVQYDSVGEIEITAKVDSPALARMFRVRGIEKAFSLE